MIWLCMISFKLTYHELDGLIHLQFMSVNVKIILNLNNLIQL